MKKKGKSRPDGMNRAAIEDRWAMCRWESGWSQGLVRGEVVRVAMSYDIQRVTVNDVPAGAATAIG